MIPAVAIQNYRGGNTVLPYWTMTTHAGQGTLSGALPSGRKCKSSFFKRDHSGSHRLQRVWQKLFNSVASLNNNHIPGAGVKYQIHTLLQMKTKKHIWNTFGDLVEEDFFKMAVCRFQLTYQDYETLIEAKKYPEKIPEMIVRVSGYSAYFRIWVTQMKDELIMRNQYNLFPDRCFPFLRPFIMIIDDPFFSGDPKKSFMKWFDTSD